MFTLQVEGLTGVARLSIVHPSGLRKHLRGGGGGGGGFSPDFCKNTILRYELAMMARTCTNNLRVVLSPYVQHCPCEASEQKMGPKNQYIKQGDRA